MGFTVTDLDAVEILDSRSRPTLQVRLRLGDGTKGWAGVPSGASTGSLEAVELRDGDPARYQGQGVLKACAHVRGELAELLGSKTWESLAEVDAAMVTADGTGTKSRLGANAIVGCSVALARALAASAGQEPYAWLTPEGVQRRLPVPHFNVLNGGVHAPNPLDFQEFMVAPLGAPSYAEAVRAGSEVYAALRKRLADDGHATGLGDEGGFAPSLRQPEDALRVIVSAIEDAGYIPGPQGVAIALDPAASEFRQKDGTYLVAGEHLSTDDLIVRYESIVRHFPVWSLEDGLAEDDDTGWRRLTRDLGGRVQLVGDDNFVTNPAIITEAVLDEVANAALIKLNQIGTVTETLQALKVCRDAGYGAMISHRSGETPDPFIADLAVASGCGQIKSGAPARGERVAKYNRLLDIAAHDTTLPYGLPNAS
ncbi:phosphopyruvate hydratase [Streptomyces sp. GZWMJZ-114]|uniref:phosphopyruvate hydratase n=1 Tax=Streptomyces sp. GZWMJZ-114 TaxID=2494734 RepID=UPI001012B3D7|nr:phosphopyruvate hydratase [Streptomyces sp. GZWMJZ-114]